jgi:hypothetical protein
MLTISFLYSKMFIEGYPLWSSYQRHGDTDRVEFGKRERLWVRTPLSTLFVFFAKARTMTVNTVSSINTVRTVCEVK